MYSRRRLRLASSSIAFSRCAMPFGFFCSRRIAPFCEVRAGVIRMLTQDHARSEGNDFGWFFNLTHERHALPLLIER